MGTHTFEKRRRRTRRGPDPQLPKSQPTPAPAAQSPARHAGRDETRRDRTSPVQALAAGVRFRLQPLRPPPTLQKSGKRSFPSRFESKRTPRAGGARGRRPFRTPTRSPLPARGPPPPRPKRSRPQAGGEEERRRPGYLSRVWSGALGAALVGRAAPKAGPEPRKAGGQGAEGPRPAAAARWTRTPASRARARRRPRQVRGLGAGAGGAGTGGSGQPEFAPAPSRRSRSCALGRHSGAARAGGRRSSPRSLEPLAGAQVPGPRTSGRAGQGRKGRTPRAGAPAEAAGTERSQRPSEVGGLAGTSRAQRGLAGGSPRLFGRRRFLKPALGTYPGRRDHLHSLLGLGHLHLRVSFSVSVCIVSISASVSTPRAPGRPRLAPSALTRAPEPRSEP